MTHDQSNSTALTADQFNDRATALLSPADAKALMDYRNDGKMRLAPATAASFFELFLNGSECEEIHRLNSAFPYPAILWARVEQKWDEQRDKYIGDLQLKIRDKLVKAQVESMDLMADMLVAAKKFHGDKLKKYIQSGNPKDLDGAMQATSIQSLVKVIEGLQKLTGQDKKFKIEKEDTTNVNINVTGAGTMSSEAAGKILEIVAAEKRKKANEEGNR